MRGKRENLVGRIFGWLLVVARAPRGKSYDSRWECVCRCGAIRVVYGISLKSGETKSCRCYCIANNSRLRRTHGLSRHGSREQCREYVSWQGAKQRCYYVKGEHFKWYGARGIKMCMRWRRSFETFFSDMGPCPKGLSVDRINNNGNYACGRCKECVHNGWTFNCRWATPLQQVHNRRKPVRKS